MLGRSGATFEFGETWVIKRGGITNLEKQALLIQYLGPQVAPEILYYGRDWYHMERLQPLESIDRPYATLILQVYDLLYHKIWGRSIQHWNGYWRVDIANYLKAEGAEELNDHMDNLYGTHGGNEYKTLIHGDCTLANVMKRRTDQFVLIDPLPADSKRPSLREIDVASLLQSAAGWEHAIAPDIWPEPDSEFLFEWIFKPFDRGDLFNQKCFFWAAVKCVKIMHHDYDELSVTWARNWYPRFLEKLQ